MQQTDRKQLKTTSANQNLALGPVLLIHAEVNTDKNLKPHTQFY